MVAPGRLVAVDDRAGELAGRPLAARGITQVTAEADVTNGPSRAMLARFGARRTAGTVELRRPANRRAEQRRGD